MDAAIPMLTLLGQRYILQCLQHNFCNLTVKYLMEFLTASGRWGIETDRNIMPSSKHLIVCNMWRAANMKILRSTSIVCRATLWWMYTSDRHMHLPTRQATVLCKGEQVPVAKSPWQLHFEWWPLIFAAFQYEICFMSPSRILKFWGGFYSFRKYLPPWS